MGNVILAASSSKSGGGSYLFLVAIVVLFGLLYFVTIRPQRRRQQAAAQTRRAHRPITPDRSASDLSRPKYPPSHSGDLSIRRENESLRNHLLGQTPIGSSLRR